MKNIGKSEHVWTRLMHQWCWRVMAGSSCLDQFYFATWLLASEAFVFLDITKFYFVYFIHSSNVSIYLVFQTTFRIA